MTAGAFLALLGATLNHYLSGRRWETERRDREVAHWRDFSDKWFNFTMTSSQTRNIVLASEIPRSLRLLADQQSHDLAESKLLDGHCPKERAARLSR